MYLFFRLTYLILFWLLCSFWLWLNGNVKTSFTIKNNCPKFRTSNFFMNENWISTEKDFCSKRLIQKVERAFYSQVNPNVLPNTPPSPKPLKTFKNGTPYHTTFDETHLLPFGNFEGMAICCFVSPVYMGILSTR